MNVKLVAIYVPGYKHVNVPQKGLRESEEKAGTVVMKNNVTLPFRPVNTNLVVLNKLELGVFKLLVNIL